MSNLKPCCPTLYFSLSYEGFFEEQSMQSDMGHLNSCWDVQDSCTLRKGKAGALFSLTTNPLPSFPLAVVSERGAVCGETLLRVKERQNYWWKVRKSLAPYFIVAGRHVLSISVKMSVKKSVGCDGKAFQHSHLNCKEKVKLFLPENQSWFCW